MAEGNWREAATCSLKCTSCAVHASRSCDYRCIGRCHPGMHILVVLGTKSTLASSFLSFECLIVPPKNERLLLVAFTEAKLAAYTGIEYPLRMTLRLCKRARHLALDLTACLLKRRNRRLLRRGMLVLAGPLKITWSFHLTQMTGGTTRRWRPTLRMQ